MWLMVRAAPGVRATMRLSGGMAAYHLALFEARRSAAERRVRAMGVRNLVVAGVVRLAGLARGACCRGGCRHRSGRSTVVVVD